MACKCHLSQTCSDIAVSISWRCLQYKYPQENSRNIMYRLIFNAIGFNEKKKKEKKKRRKERKKKTKKKKNIRAVETLHGDKVEILCNKFRKCSYKSISIRIAQIYSNKHKFSFK